MSGVYIKDGVSKKKRLMGERIERAKSVIGIFYKMAECGLFFSRNIVGDRMDNIYDDGEIRIDICLNYEYFEVFGLTIDEQEELTEYYKALLESS